MVFCIVVSIYSSFKKTYHAIVFPRGRSIMKKNILTIFILYIAALLLPASALAACSTVKIEILQELTLEHIAFDAKLRVANNISDKSLDSVRVDIIIRDAIL